MEARAWNRWTVKALLWASAMLLGAGAAWWGLSRERQAVAEYRPVSQAPKADTRTPDSAPAGAPLPRGAFQDIHQELEVRARAGEARAAYRLGQVISRCVDYKPIPGGQFTEMLARAIAHADSATTVGGRRLDDPNLLDAMLYAKDEIDRICDGIGELPASLRKGDARAWFEMAAERGHAKAMIGYAGSAFVEFASDAELLDNAAEVAARRERARDYLRRAFESGEPESLLALAASHGNRAFLGRDMTEALAYWKAYRRTAEGRKLPEGVVRMMEQQLLSSSDPRQLRDSERRSVEILQAFQQHRAPR